MTAPKRPTDAAIQKLEHRFTALCLALPEAELRGGQHKAYLVRNKKFAYFINDHHGDDRVAVQMRAARGLNSDIVASDPGRFFLPPYLAHHGWIGLWLDLPGVPVDWDEIDDLVRDGYRLAAPKSLAARLDAS